MHTEEKAALIADVAGRTTVATASGTVVAGLTLNELAAVIGIAATLLTLCINLIYQHLHYRLKRERLALDDEAGEK